MQPRRSLKSRALQLLAQRDQSRLELRRKLLRHARKDAADAAAADAVRGADSLGSDFVDVDVDVDTAADDAAAAADAQVEALLDWLEANRFLSSERFVESRVHAREARFGNRRIESELAQHALALPPELAAHLAETEMARAAAVRARRFDAVPRDVGERAAQSRFLAGRGFSPELIHRLMRQLRTPSHGERLGSEAEAN